jgi:hypothetical protein
MKDRFAQELSIGDKIAFNPPVYKGLVVGEVIGFTARQVRVKYHSFGHQTSDLTLVWPEWVVKAPVPPIIP